MKRILLWATVLLVLCGYSHGYRILGIFPVKAKSHHIVGSALLKGLAEKGHDVTMMSAFPYEAPIKNYRDISVDNIVKNMKSAAQATEEFSKLGIIEALNFIMDSGVTWTKELFEDTNVKQIMSNKSETFDLVIVENIINEAMVGFGQYFQAPVISVSAFGASLMTCDMVGSPSPPSYVPNIFLSFTDHMTLPERLGNLAFTVFERVYSDFFYLPRQEAIYNQVFPDPKPSFEEIRKNVSLVLLNSHVSVGYPRPYVPNMIEVGGMHINRKPKSLPADLQEYLDAANEGVIFFSMGSNFNSNLLPREKLDHLINTFKSLKQKVLWKWEDDNLPGKSDNIYISKWFPQDDILAHPNVKLFITHGGLLSITETIYHGVPVIGIPMFADQFLNMGKIVRAQIGVLLQYDALTSDALRSAISEVLETNRYTNSMQELSRRYRDQPMSPLDTAIYWVEYVARHKGAPHLRSGAQDLSFLAYHNLDAFAILGAGFFLAICLVVVLMKKILSCGRTFLMQPERKEKTQ